MDSIGMGTSDGPLWMPCGVGNIRTISGAGPLWDSQCMPCVPPRIYTGLALYGAVDCPRASCDLGIKILMLWSQVWDPRVSEGVPSDAVRARADAVRALEQPTASLADQYVTNTGPLEPTSMGAVWTSSDTLRAQNRRKPISESCTCSSFSHDLYEGSVCVQQSSKNRTNPQRSHPPSLIRVFATRLIGKQGHKASSYKQRSLIKLSWAHMTFRFCIIRKKSNFKLFLKNVYSPNNISQTHDAVIQ